MTKTKELMMNVTPYVIMGCSVLMIVVTVVDALTR